LNIPLPILYTTVVGKVQIKQREYAQLLEEAGADLIIGHGAHMMQSIEKINRTTSTPQ
jgi:poly-gamma-glutamate capsule biosynthesis protein CapA/YwtB (metallophosphatase superfamily)